MAARLAMLDRCLASVLAAPPPLCDAPPLLAFLAPTEGHWEEEGAGAEGPPPARRRGGAPAGAGAAAALTGQMPRQPSLPGSAAGSSASSADASNKCDLLLALLHPTSGHHMLLGLCFSSSAVRPK